MDPTLKNTIVHPYADEFAHVVSLQPEWRALVRGILEVGKSHPGETTGMRVSLSALDDPRMEPLFQEFLRITKPPTSEVTGVSHGIEISPRGKPMLKSNLAVSECVDPGEKSLVSRNVVNNMSVGEKAECAKFDGIHHFTLGEISKPTIKEPVMVKSNIDEGYETGFLKKDKNEASWYTFSEETVKIRFHEVQCHSYILDSRRAEQFLMEPGKYELRGGLAAKVEKTDLPPIKRLPRDMCGAYLQDANTFGHVSPKFDGILYILESDGEIVQLKSRDGRVWKSAADGAKYRIQLEKSRKGTDFVVTTVRWKENFVPFEAIPFFRSKKRFELVVDGEEWMSGDGGALPSDGFVISKGLCQWFVKDTPSVDINRAQMEHLASNGMAVNIPEGKVEEIWEMLVCGGVLTPRCKRKDRAFPNGLERVRGVLASITVSMVKDSHGDCDCMVCK